MTKHKSTKRALLMSGLALFACISMLVGSTFAWFTDSVTSANNIIKSGNLDIELEYLDANGKWADVKDASNILSEDLYEPGYVQVAYLRLKNAGSLALKYQLGVNIVDEKAGTNVAGKPFNLSDYIYFDVIEGVNGETGAYADRAAAMKAVADAKQIKEGYTKAASMLAGEELYLALVVYMPETVGNEANHNGKDIPQIDLGINVYATQYTYEEDSFDKYYDESAAVFTVAEANALMKKGKDATLVNCTDFAGILEVPANYNGTLTLVNSTVKSVQAAGDANVIILGDVVINAKGNSRAAFDGSAISANGKLTISGKGNLTAIAADMNGAFGIGGMNATAVTIKDITIDYVSGGHAYGVGTDTKYYKDAPEGGAAIGSGYNGAVITLDNVTVTKAIGGSKAAGIGARYHVGVTVNINDSEIVYVEGGVSAAGIGGSRISSGATENGTTINIENSTITAQGGVYGAGIGSGYDTHCLTAQPLCTINIADSTIKATGGQYAAGVGTGYHHAALAGEIKNSTVTAVSGEKIYKASYTPAMDVGFGVTDPKREGQQTGSKLNYNGVEITLASAPNIVEPENLADELKNNANILLVGGNYKLPSLAGKEGITIVGSADTVIGGGATGFGGNFGKNTTIKNVTFSGTSNGVRYSYAQGGTSTFENCTFAGGSTYGFHIDESNGATFIFNNCTFSGFNAFAGDLVKVEFNNCTFLHNGNYGHTNIWSVAYFNDCTFGDKASVSTAGSGKLFFDGVTYVTTNAQLDTAVKAGATSVYLAPGEYDVYGCGGKTLTISGTKDAIIKVANEGEAGSDYGFDGSTVTFNGITFDTSANNGNYKGFARMVGTYNNCTFEGSYALNKDSVFTGCTFNVSGDAYNVWTWGAPNATFDGCTFNSDGKSVLLYGGVDTKLTVNNCVFNDKGGLSDLKAAVEIGNDYGRSYELIVNNTTVNGYEINDKGINTGSTLWGNKNSMGTDKLNVVIDGVDVY